MLVWIRIHWKIWRKRRWMSVYTVECQILFWEEMLPTVCTLKVWVWGNSVCCFCVTSQFVIWWKTFITLVTLERFHPSFHRRKWQRGVGDNWWPMDWILSVHPWRRFRLPFQEFVSSFSISPQSWRTGLLLLVWQRCSLLGLQGEGEVGTNSDRDRESFALASQSLAESQALGCQRQVIFRRSRCRHFCRISELINLLEQETHVASSTHLHSKSKLNNKRNKILWGTWEKNSHLWTAPYKRLTHHLYFLEKRSST